MKRIAALIGAALLVMMVGIAQAYIDPSDIHVNDGTAYLFSDSDGVHVHALTDPSTITLQGNHAGVTITDVFLVFAIPGESDSLATTANGVSGTNMGDLFIGLNGSNNPDVYGDVLGLTGANNSENFVNFTKFADQSATNFDIWTFDLNTTLSQASPVSVDFSNGPSIGTYVFAYGFGDDGKLYVTPFTETGLQVPEPSTLLLLGSGLLGLAFFGRKKLGKIS